MQIRKIRPEEMVLQEIIANVAFLGEPLDFTEKLKSPLEHSEGYEKVWGGFNGGGKMCAVTTVNNHRVRFCGHTVDMGGVGAVGTLPEARSGGYIRRIMEAALPIMREEGKIFSFLYPFSHPFYRKFGYELCYMPNRASIPVKYFREYKFPEGMEQHVPGVSKIEELMDVYNEHIKDKTLSMVRDVAAMRRRVEKNPYVKRLYTYLHRAPNGSADAYITYHASGGDEDRELKVRELIWTTPESMRAIFGFIGQLSPEFVTLKWDAPPSLKLPSLFGEAFDFNIETPPHGMNRIVNLQKALELLPAPRQNGSVVLRISDGNILQNDGTWNLEWEDGKISPVKPSIDTPSLETDIQTLTQLVTGFLSLDAVRLRGTAAINSKAELLSEIFPPRELFIADFF